MQNFVFVLDTNKQPLAPCHQAVSRKLLKQGKAAIWKRYPFTIILKKAVENPDPMPVQVKIDPGSKTTGIALVQDDQVIFAAELAHRGQAIKDALESRKALRRGRRNRKTRYRKPGFQAGKEVTSARPEGWLAPSIKSRVDNVQAWLVKFIKLCNVQAISMELVRFDTQLMQNAEISGVQYQQGELQGYEVREYLLEKFGRKCAYCGKKDCALEVEHIQPKSRGGTNSVINLCLACHECNQAKGNQTAKEFGYPEVQAQAKATLKDAAAVNSARWELWRRLNDSGLSVEADTGGRTKFNRTAQGYPKAHWIDAACVGETGAVVELDASTKPLLIKAVGRGSRQMCHVNKYGFPRTKAKSGKRFFGFQTGDMVRAVVPSGKHKGVHVGKVAVRAQGSFAILFQKGKIDGINWKYFKLSQRSDGYSYSARFVEDPRRSLVRGDQHPGLLESREATDQLGVAPLCGGRSRSGNRADQSLVP